MNKVQNIDIGENEKSLLVFRKSFNYIMPWFKHKNMWKHFSNGRIEKDLIYAVDSIGVGIESVEGKNDERLHLIQYYTPLRFPGLFKTAYMLIKYILWLHARGMSTAVDSKNSSLYIGYSEFYTMTIAGSGPTKFKQQALEAAQNISHYGFELNANGQFFQLINDVREEKGNGFYITYDPLWMASFMRKMGSTRPRTKETIDYPVVTILSLYPLSNSTAIFIITDKILSLPGEWVPTKGSFLTKKVTLNFFKADLPDDLTKTRKMLRLIDAFYKLERLKLIRIEYMDKGNEVIHHEYKKLDLSMMSSDKLQRKNRIEKMCSLLSFEETQIQFEVQQLFFQNKRIMVSNDLRTDKISKGEVQFQFKTVES